MPTPVGADPASLPSGGSGGQLPQKAQMHGGILRLPAVEASDQGQYLCRAQSSAGQHVARAVLHVHGERTRLSGEDGGALAALGRCSHRALSAGGSGPRVQVSPERTQVHEGRTVRLYCRAAGVPSATITWRKEGGSLPPQVRVPARPSPSTCPLPPPLSSSSSLHFPEDALIKRPAPGVLAGGSCQPPALLRGCPPRAPVPALSWPVPLCLPSLASPCQAAFDPFSPCGRPAQSAQTSPHCSSLPSRLPTPASTSVWPPAPRALPRPGFKWLSFQVRGPQGLEE